MSTVSEQPKTKKETIEFSRTFLNMWNDFCLEKGITKRQASHAAYFVFINATAPLREEYLAKGNRYTQEFRQRLGARDPSRNRLTKHSIAKETIEYSTQTLSDWDDMCHAKGLVKRHAAVAARLYFMDQTATEREEIMASVAKAGRARAS